MEQTKFIKLKYKLGMLVTLIILISMLPTTYISTSNEADLLRAEMEEKAWKIARSAGAMAFMKTEKNYISENNEIQWDLVKKSINLVYQLDNPTETVQLDKNILYIIVVDKDGNIPIADINTSLLKKLTKDVDSKDIIEKLKQDVKKSITQKTDIDKLNTLKLLRPIKSIKVELKPEDNYIGTMEICFSLKEIENILAKKWQDGIRNTIIIVIIGIIFSITFASMITKPINTLATSMQKVRDGDFNQEVNVKSHDELGMLAQTFNFMTKGLLEREKFKAERDKIRSTFNKYVSPQVVEKILQENIPTAGDKKKITVLFSDIRGFTSMSEKMEPQDLIALLNEYFSIMVDIIFKYEGTLDKYIGDAMMAEFGAPITGPFDELKAVLTAFEMQKALTKFNEALKKRGINPIYMGIGINTGEAVAGNIGSPRRMEYSVLGDNVNLSSRLCSNAKGGQIIISEATYKEVDKYIEVIKPEPIMVKGKSYPIVIYEVTGIKPEIDLNTLLDIKNIG